MPAECFPPGDFLGEEMAERGLDVEWLCGVLRCDDYGALALLKGERAINALEAGRLGRALGTGPELWLNLEASWQSWCRHVGVREASRPVPDARTAREG